MKKILKKLIKTAIFEFEGEEWFILEMYIIRQHPDYSKKRWDDAMWDGSDVKYTNKLTDWANKRINKEISNIIKNIK